jgi:hypothetical protein
MALSFKNQKGKAQRNSAPRFEFKDGENRFRIVGDILPRYVYWVGGNNGKNIPFECLAFNRNSEEFDHSEKDYVQEYYPDLKCGWAYACQVIDPTDGTVKVLDLKKKMWEQICNAAEDLGDPTDVDTGWDVVVKRSKSGPLPFNVEYTLQVLRCKTRPLTESERALIADLKSMEEVVPRPTPDKQKAQLEKLKGSFAESGADGADDSSIDEEFDIK